VDPPIAGVCNPRFLAGREAFVQNFIEGDELGAGVSVILDSRVVVDLTGGWADQARRRPWGADTLVDIYSAGKPLVALAALRVVERGLLGLDDPISSVWSEFAAHGKGRATLRQALCHRAGVPALP
jgi:CubicO group peptidase (beta-lactamase class C family)